MHIDHHQGRARGPAIRARRPTAAGRTLRAATDLTKRAVKAHAKRWLIVGGVVVVAVVMLLVLMIAAVTGVPRADDLDVLAALEGFLTPEQVERLDELMAGIHRPRDIPLLPFALYVLAADEHELDWAVLAGIGKAECDHGRSQLEGCNPPGTINEVGARGPMQFLGSTWRADADALDLDVSGAPIPDGAESRGYATDGDGDGTADPWVANDAIHATARYLARNRAPADYDHAIWAYNHSDAYRAEVLRRADTYRAEAASSSSPEGAGGAGADVTQVTCTSGQSITVAAGIADSLQQMLDDAGAGGVALCGWGYRDPEEQIALRREHCGTSDYAINEMPSSQCSPPTARPGTSMHEQGLAVDFTDCSSHSTPCWQWLDAHAATYGFYNYEEEPWHWSIDGT